jgi:hypothetical protein
VRQVFFPNRPIHHPGVPIVEMTFTALANGRKALRHLEQADVVLSEEERDRLTQEKSAYTELFDKLLNTTTP